MRSIWMVEDRPSRSSMGRSPIIRHAMTQGPIAKGSAPRSPVYIEVFNKEEYSKDGVTSQDNRERGDLFVSNATCIKQADSIW
jgi:hypothetical protein